MSPLGEAAFQSSLPVSFCMTLSVLLSGPVKVSLRLSGAYARATPTAVCASDRRIGCTPFIVSVGRGDSEYNYFAPAVTSDSLGTAR